MSRIILYIATSLDGYIAREDGGIDWLEKLPMPEGEDFGYTEFYENVSTVVMGRKTYDEVMGFGVEWPYTKCESYVVTTNPSYKTQTVDTHVLNVMDASVIDRLRKESKGNVWLIGGGQLNTEFLKEGAVDEMIISIFPVILGSGLPLFAGNPPETWFKRADAKAYENGVVMLKYF